MNKLFGSLVVIGLVVLIGLQFTKTPTPEALTGSVAIGNEYQSTTTGPTTGYNLAPQIFTLSGSGTLGTILITGTAANIITVYDATTTDVTKRAGATSTLRVLASFPTSPTIGDYPYDTVFFNGLLYSSVGAQSTTTVTYRLNN